MAPGVGREPLSGQSSAQCPDCWHEWHSPGRGLGGACWGLGGYCWDLYGYGWYLCGCSGGLRDGTGVGGRGGGSEVEAPSKWGRMLRAAARAPIRLS
jgi:hypothetical protein